MRLVGGVVFLAPVLAVFACAATKESVRAELIRQQTQNGLSLVSVEGIGRNQHLSVVVFATRSLSEMHGLGEENVGEGVAQDWSPNRNQFVSQAEQTLRVYDKQTGKSWPLTKGQYATWSPDGNWIAFFEDGAYYAIRPSGSGKKLLFKQKDALTPLWWSPDSRLVAYVSRNRFFEGRWWPPIEQGRLRVRRLEDNAEDWVANLYVEGHVPSFRWVEGMKPTSNFLQGPGEPAYRRSSVQYPLYVTGTNQSGCERVRMPA